jgi:hypothetical protein
MTGTTFAIAGAYAAFGIGLAAMPVRHAAVIVALMIASVLATASLVPAQMTDGQALILLSGSIVLTATMAIFAAHGPAALWHALAILVGASIGTAGSATEPVLVAAPMLLALLFLPARVLAAGPRRFAINILSSWLIAIGLISGAFAFAPSAGPAGDHAL